MNFGMPQWTYQELTYLAFLIAVNGIRLPYQWKSRRNRVVAHRVTAAERIMVAGIGLGMIVLPLISMATPLLRFADYAAPFWFPFAGFALILPTLFLFWRSHADLGRHWSVTLEVHEEHALMTHGVYAHIRHPMYAAAWLWVIVQGLLIPNVIGGLSGLATFGLLYFLRVGAEEAMMQARFGDEYAAYAAQTNRLLPNLFGT